MTRMIDGDKLVENLRLIATCWSISPFVSKEKHNGAVNMLREVEREVKEAPTLTPQNEWVSVEERLPEKGQIVLFHQKDGFIYCAEYFAGNSIMSTGWFIDNDCWEAEEVTHWMPLPKSPKADE